AGNGASATLTGVPSAGATLTGVAAPNGKRKKRPSSLLAVATSLPSVESSLDEFIARANQTMVDQQNWDLAEREAKQEDEKRKEADALRWKAAEQQLREHEARETSLRRQLDGLQGKLAEAEARVAVALSSSGQMAAAQSGQLEAQASELVDLRTRLGR